MSRSTATMIPQADALGEKRRRGRPRAAAVSLQEQQTRARILDTALDVFSLQGFDGASVADIARRDGVSPPLVHYHFETKEKLWQAAVDFGVGDAITQLSSLLRDLQDADSISRLKFFIRRYINIVAEKPAAFRLIIRESEIPGERFDWLAQRHLVPLYQMWAQLVEAGQRDGRIKDGIEPFHIASIIASASSQFVMSSNRLKATFGIETTTVEMREKHASVLIEVVFNGALVDSSRDDQAARV